MAHTDTRAQRRPQYNGRFTDATRRVVAGMMPASIATRSGHSVQKLSQAHHDGQAVRPPKGRPTKGTLIFH